MHKTTGGEELQIGKFRLMEVLVVQEHQVKGRTDLWKRVSCHRQEGVQVKKKSWGLVSVRGVGFFFVLWGF